MRGPWRWGWSDFEVAADRIGRYVRRVAAQAICGVPGGETPEQTCSHRTAAVNGLYRYCVRPAIGIRPRAPPLATLAVSRDAACQRCALVDGARKERDRCQPAPLGFA